MTRELSWFAAQRWRLRVARRDGSRLLRGLAGTLRFAVAPPRPHPSLALLEGAATAHAGAASTYRVRLYNPTDAQRTVRLAVRGFRVDGARLDFTAACEMALAPGAVAERWLSTTWTGDAAFLPHPPTDEARTWAPEEPPVAGAERWVVEATLEERGEELERLRIGGVLR